MNYNYLKKNEEVRRNINRYKTTREKITKIKSSITFLIKCRNTGIIPNFIKNSTKNCFNIFEVNGSPNDNKTISRYIEDFQNKMLKLMIREKHEGLKQTTRYLESIQYNLSRYLSQIEMNSFLENEDRISLKFNRKIKEKHRQKFDKLSNMRKRELGIKLNGKWFVNKSKVDIPIDTQWVLSLGHKHSLPVKRKNFPILRMITDGEDFVQTIKGKEEQEIARSRLTSIIDDHIGKIKLTNRDKFIMDKVDNTTKFLKRNRNVVILNADKGNTTVAIDRCDYVSRMDKIVGDITTYGIMNKDPTSRLQKLNNDIVEDLFREHIITQLEKNKLKTNVAIAPKLYGVPKIHKEDFPLRPICSFINSPSYELCKYIVKILRKLTDNSIYNVKDSIQFKNRIKNIRIQDDEKLVSFDVVSLFPSIPVDLAISIIEGKWDELKNFTNMEKNIFLRIIKFCIVDNRYFQYDGKIYSQQKGLPMGSPASPVIADIVMEKLLDTCIGKLTVKPKIITKYVDDLFCITSESTVDDILSIFNSFHPDIKFTLENECDSKISYLDTLIKRRDNSLLINWYQKPTSSGRIINYYSKHPRRIIINTAKNFIERVLNISDIIYHKENKKKIINILNDNNFPNQLIYQLIGQYNNRKDNNTIRVGEPKIYKSLTYIPMISERLEKSKIFDVEKYKMAHKMENTVGKLFTRVKDSIPKMERHDVVYKIPCRGGDNEDCNRVYVGTTKNKLKTRIAGHKSDQKYRNTTTQKTALSSHCAELDHYPDFENTIVLNTEHNYKRRYMLEMLQIINVPTADRINYKVDTEKVAQIYRNLVFKNKTGS